MKTPKQRTAQQRKAVEVYFREVSMELNNAGIGMANFLKDFEIDVTPQSVKDVFRAIGKAKYGKESTADLTTTELQGCWEEFNRALGWTGLEIPFPNSTGFTDEIINNYGYDK
jgi:hypothetical protein